MSLPRFTFTSRARPWLQVGVGDSRVPIGQARWQTSRWSDPAATWAGIEPTWLDVSCEAFRCRCEYGRRRSTDRFVPGVATIEVNNASGWADPHATDDPALLAMRPGRAIRFGVDHATLGRVVLWRGFIDAMTPTYDPSVPDSVTMQCVDALGEVNRAKLADQPARPAGETVAARIAHLLQAIGWPASKSIVGASSMHLIAAELNGQAADLLGRAADSGGGSLFGDREANVVFRGRDWQTYVPGTPPDGTIGNVEATDVCPVQWERPFNRADIATVVIMGRDIETATVVRDVDGAAVYGEEPFERTDLWTQNDTDLLTLANRALRVRSWSTAPVLRSVTLDASTSAGALDLMTQADPYEPSRYRCRLQLDRGLVFDAEHLVTGIVHELTADTWEANVNLDLAEPYAVAGGRWDSAMWDRAAWTNAAALALAARQLATTLGGLTP